MEEEQRRAAKRQMIALMQAGHSWQEAAAMAGVRMGRSAAYQLLRNMRLQGEIALQDGSHGHPAKLREPIRQWLEMRLCCKNAGECDKLCIYSSNEEEFLSWTNSVRSNGVILKPRSY